MHPNPETIFSPPNLLWPTTFDVLNSTPHLGRESDIILFFPTLSCARHQPPQVKGRNLERSQSLRLTHSGCIMYITSWFFKQIVLHQERICSISNLYYAPDNDCRFTVLHLQCSVRLLSKLRLLLAAALNLFQASAAAEVLLLYWVRSAFRCFLLILTNGLHPAVASNVGLNAS